MTSGQKFHNRVGPWLPIPCVLINRPLFLREDFYLTNTKTICKSHQSHYSRMRSYTKWVVRLHGAVMGCPHAHSFVWYVPLHVCTYTVRMREYAFICLMIYMFDCMFECRYIHVHAWTSKWTNVSTSVLHVLVSCAHANLCRPVGRFAGICGPCTAGYYRDLNTWNTFCFFS